MRAILKSNRINIILGYVIMMSAFIYQVVFSILLLVVPRWIFYKRKDISGKRVLITGAGSGLGRQMAIEFSKHDTCLLLVDIDSRSLLQTQKLVEHGRSTVFLYECDVSDYKNVCEMAQKVRRDAGDVDILVNNAGIVSGKYLVDLSEHNIVRTMEVNALAHFWTVKAFLPSMMERNTGHIVSIASVLGKVGAPKAVDYCSSKYAAVGFAESLEIEMRERNLDGIKVTLVCPSHMDTGLFAGADLSLGTSLSPEYAAKEVVLGIQEEQELITLPYFVRFVPLTKECLPRWVEIKIYEISGAIKLMKNFTGKPMNGVQQNGMSEGS